MSFISLLLFISLSLSFVSLFGSLLQLCLLNLMRFFFYVNVFLISERIFSFLL